MALDGALKLAQSEWVKLTGLLNHLVYVLLMPYYVMYGVYSCLDQARERGLGPDVCLLPNAAGAKSLKRWRAMCAHLAVRHRYGTTALAALYPVRRPACRLW